MRYILFFTIFYGLSLPLGGVITLGALVSEKAIGWGARTWGGWFLWCTRHILGIRLQIRGAVPQSGAIVAMKHQSAYETIVTLAIFHYPAVVMKAELADIPIWGRISRRHGSIFVNRAAGASSIRSMLRQARARAAEGRPIVIFPEGTRIPPGERGEVKAGLYALASGTRLPVVPVSLDAGLCWSKGFTKTPGIVTLAFQPAIDPSLPRETFEQLVEDAINSDPRTVEVQP